MSTAVAAGPLPGVVGGFSGWALSTEPVLATGPGDAAVIVRTPRGPADLVPGGSARDLAAAAASRIGVGPAVVGTDPVTGAVALEHLDTPWQVATLGRLVAYGAVGALGAARSAFRDADVELPDRDVVADVRALRQRAEGLGWRPVDEVTRLLDLVEPVAAAVAGGPAARASWGAADVSSVLVHPSGAVRLVGGTFAGRTDPLADLGALVAELCPFVADPTEIVVAGWGSAAPGVLARVHLHGFLDDVRQALWSLVVGLVAGRPGDDHGSYTGYRLRRAAYAAHGTGQFDTWLRQAADGWEG